jgi:two-component system, chemotaxis family, chemotaxis protein CheY
MAFNVLIVDDSSTMRSVIKKIIKVSGFEVGNFLEAGDGLEALEVLRHDWVDLVLSDINMPNMNGLDLIGKMSEDDILKSIPIVMVTTEGSDEKVEKSKALGAAGYIKKPFLPEDIRLALCNIMGEEIRDEKEYDDDAETGDF